MTSPAAASAAAAARLLVVCGPSGSGKSTLLTRLFGSYPGKFGFSVSHTTRSPRPGEVNGREYQFVSRSEFTAAVERNEFIEWAEFSGNHYGTSKSSVGLVMASGVVCVLDIDVQGVKQLKSLQQKESSSASLFKSARLVFIRPPSLSALKSRLLARGTETEESLARRLAAAEEELEYGCSSKGNFDLVITNEDVEEAYKQLDLFVKPMLASDGRGGGGRGSGDQ